MPKVLALRSSSAKIRGKIRILNFVKCFAIYNLFTILTTVQKKLSFLKRRLMRVCQKAFQKLARDVDEGLRVAEEPDTRFVRHHHDL